MLLQNSNKKAGEENELDELRAQTYPITKRIEDDEDAVAYEKLSAEIEILQSTLENLHIRKKNIQIIND